MVRHFLPCSLLLLSAVAHSQGRWDAYLARYENGAGTVMLDMSLQKNAPRADLPYLVITGVDIAKCTGEGFPQPDQFNTLYQVSDEVNRIVFNRAGGLLAGTFTYNCQRLDYIYVRDTMHVRKDIETFYSRKKNRKYQHHIRIMQDITWDAYLNFLYPNDAVKELMTNHSALTKMQEQGDHLARPRFVEHLIYFESAESQENFIQYIGRMKYDIVSTRHIPGGKRPHQLRISKFEMINLELLTAETSFLRAKANEFGGMYDGWETRGRGR